MEARRPRPAARHRPRGQADRRRRRVRGPRRRHRAQAHRRRPRSGRRAPRFAEDRAAGVGVGAHATTGRVPDAAALVRARPRPHRRAARAQRRARVAPRLHEGAARPLDRRPQVRLEHHAAALLRRAVPGLVLRRLRRTRARDRGAAPRRPAREPATRRRVREVRRHRVHRRSRRHGHVDDVVDDAADQRELGPLPRSPGRRAACR